MATRGTGKGPIDWRTDYLAQVERTIEAASKAVSEQMRCVTRQRQRVEALEREGHKELAEHSRQVLQRMEEILARSQAELSEAEQRRHLRK